MKVTIWDILAILAVLAACVFGVLAIQIFSNPYSLLNPFPPPTQPAVLELPSATATQPRLPATWTPEGGEIIIEPTLMNSSTPLPTATSFTLSTLTPSVTFTPEFSETPTITETLQISLTPTTGPDAAKWLGNEPEDFTTLTAGQDFDMVWLVKNTGTKTWTTSYSYRYKSGEKTHEKSSYNLKSSISPGASVDLIVDMVAPTKSGTYTLYWELVNDEGNAFYTVNFTFTVR